MFSSSAWSSSSYIGIQEVLTGQIDAAEHQMFFGHFQLFVLPASPPLESLPQQRAWKLSFFNCQFIYLVVLGLSCSMQDLVP